MPEAAKAVVLLSGGLDSTTTAAVAQRDGFDVHALTCGYGQRHHAELAAARRVAATLGVVQHVEITVDLRQFGGSALTGDLPVPTGRTVEEIGAGVPVTYVPARNTIFLSLALAWAETLDSTDVFIGVNALDSSGYPDCRHDYLHAYQRMAALATKAGIEGRPVRIRAPLIELTKAQIVTLGHRRAGGRLGAPIARGVASGLRTASARSLRSRSSPTSRGSDARHRRWCRGARRPRPAPRPTTLTTSRRRRG